jgi:hypothetical protein
VASLVGFLGSGGGRKGDFLSGGATGNDRQQEAHGQESGTIAFHPCVEISGATANIQTCLARLRGGW